MHESAGNSLKDSVSPYLRSAAHQPVAWHEWGDAAFARARAEGKPILLDVGAVWCHWCHVIDRESYENPELAAIINEHYIPVKVDRDERPDVDSRYQAAVSAMTGQGGWPLTAFLTPEGKPFFGGTYFPPDDAMGRPGFRRILLGVAEAFRTRRDEVDKTAKAIEDAVSQAEAFKGARADFDPSAVDEMVGAIVRMFDLRNGGFGQSPKFPHAAAIDLLLERYQSTKEPALLTVVEKTLEKMAQGGVYDQLAGGFHRYSVDERWLVPHFEKMSYDNSELLKNYLHGYQVTDRPLFRETAEGIITWVNEVLSDQKHGGFYASQDADQTLEDDGDYFTWTQDELRAALTPEESRAHGALLRRRSPRRNASQSSQKCSLGSPHNRRRSPRIESQRNRRPPATRPRQRQTSRSPPPAPNSSHRHHQLRKLERHVRLSLSGSRTRSRSQGLQRFRAENHRSNLGRSVGRASEASYIA